MSGDPGPAAPTTVHGARVAVGVALTRRYAGMLLVRRGPDAAVGAGEWALPGGKVEAGETLAAAAARETLEEVGLDVETRPTGIVTEDLHWGPDQHFVTHYLQASSLGGEPRLMEPDKHDAIRWVGPDVLLRAATAGDPDLPLFPPTREFVAAGGLDRLVPPWAGPDALRHADAAMTEGRTHA